MKIPTTDSFRKRCVGRQFDKSLVVFFRSSVADCRFGDDPEVIRESRRSETLTTTSTRLTLNTESSRLTVYIYERGCIIVLKWYARVITNGNYGPVSSSATVPVLSVRFQWLGRCALFTGNVRLTTVSGIHGPLDTRPPPPSTVLENSVSRPPLRDYNTFPPF